MKRSVLAALAALVTVALASPALADVWELSWASDATGIRFGGVTPGVSDYTTTSHVTGVSMATLTNGARGTIDISFSTPAGLAALSVSHPNQVLGSVPAFMPEAAPGTVPLSLPGTPGWFLQSVGATGTFTFTGNPAHPDGFQIGARGPGSGPSVEVGFTGTGRLVPGGRPPVAQAIEPDLFLLCLGALVTVVIARRVRA